MLWRFRYKGSSGDQVDTGFNLTLRNPRNVFGEDISKIADFGDALEVFKFLRLINHISQECTTSLSQILLGFGAGNDMKVRTNFITIAIENFVRGKD